MFSVVESRSCHERVQFCNALGPKMTLVPGGRVTTKHFIILLRCAVFKILDNLNHQEHI